jgi:hypothetical protein
MYKLQLGGWKIMDINRIKLGLVYIFSENNKLGKESKIQLINFIEGANEYQLKSLALDGVILSPDQLDEQACSILDDRFAASFKIQNKLKEASLEASKFLSEISTISGAALGALASVVVPIPGSVIAGGIIGGLLGRWRKANRKRIKKFCKAKAKGDKLEYNKCIAMGNLAIKAEVEKAKAKIKAKK